MSLKQYLDEADAISRAAEAEIKAGAELTPDLLVKSHLLLPFHIAREVWRAMQTPNPQLLLEELVSEGTHRLIRAAQAYDPAQGKFSTYAIVAIKRSLWGYVNKERTLGTVRSRQAIEDAHRVSKEFARRREAGEVSTVEAVAESVGLRPERVLQLMRLVQRAASLDETIPGHDDEGTATRGELTQCEAAGPEEIVLADIEREERQELIQALRYLPEHYQKALGLTTGARTFEETALDDVVRASRYSVQRKSRQRLQVMFQRGKGNARRLGYEPSDATGSGRGSGRLSTVTSGVGTTARKSRDSAADIWRRLADRWGQASRLDAS